MILENALHISIGERVSSKYFIDLILDTLSIFLPKILLFYEIKRWLRLAIASARYVLLKRFTHHEAWSPDLMYIIDCPCVHVVFIANIAYMHPFIYHVFSINQNHEGVSHRVFAVRLS